MNFLRFLILIVLVLGLVFVVWDLVRSPKEAEAHLDDKAICADSFYWYLQGNNEVVEYCIDLKNRGL